jgi:hypothetical protein
MILQGAVSMFSMLTAAAPCDLTIRQIRLTIIRRLDQILAAMT